MQSTPNISSTRAQLDQLFALGKQAIIDENAQHLGDKSVPYFTRMRDKLAAIPSEAKIGAGISFVVAALGALGTYRAAKQSVIQDDEGKNHIQWSQAGVALLQAVLTCGCVLIGHQHLRGAAR